MSAESAASRSADIPLVGPAGEKVDLRRIFASHGLVSLPPMQLDREQWTLTVTTAVPGGGARTVRISQADATHARLQLLGGRAPGPRERTAVIVTVRHMLHLDQDLSPFYRLASDDPALAWAAQGAGRMLRSPTVFEDVVKTICTTNCAWSGTRRMIGALVEHLGEKAPGAPATGPTGRAFPTAHAMAEARVAFYKKVVGAGYRGAYLRALATSVARGRIDLESLGRARPDELADDEMDARLRALPGVGPYACAHIMLMLGRTSRLILDSWTRPEYARLSGGRASDSTIARRFRRYGPYAGLAFWLFLVREWVPDGTA